MGHAKKVVRTLIAAVLVLDALALIGSLWRFRGQCSLLQIVREIREYRAIKSYPSEVTLQRTEAGLDLWNSPEGPTWTVHGDRFLPLLLSEQERDIYEPPGHEVQKGDTVLDCGANIGVFTRKALSRGASLVVAIEPAPVTLEALRRHLAPEIRDGRVIVYPKGVWDHDTEMSLSINSLNAGANSVVGPDNSSQAKAAISLTTIDKIAAELGLKRVDFIKMDIEGAEKPALKGAENTIKRFRPRMSISSEHLPDDFATIPALVHSIEPRYSYKACDCDLTQQPVKALVLAFDPGPQ